MLEQKTEELFSVSVGNLEKDQEAKIRITFVCQLERRDDMFVFYLPAAAGKLTIHVS